MRMGVRRMRRVGRGSRGCIYGEHWRLGKGNDLMALLLRTLLYMVKVLLYLPPSRSVCFMSNRVNILFDYPKVVNLQLIPIVLHIISYTDLSFFFYCSFFPELLLGGALNSHTTTKTNQPNTVVQIPAIPIQAPLMRQLLGHSSCAKCLTVTVVFSSTFVKKGRL